MDTTFLIIYQGITFLVMLVGLISLIFIVIPGGLVVIWAAALVYGIVTGFNWINIIILILLTLQMLVGTYIDNVLMAANARAKSTSWIALVVAGVLGIIGTIVLPPFGGLLGSLLGVFIVEWIRTRNLKGAWQSTLSMASGWGWSLVIRFGIGMIMIGGWLLWVFGGYMGWM
jgi:uncharacterized protein